MLNIIRKWWSRFNQPKYRWQLTIHDHRLMRVIPCVTREDAYAALDEYIKAHWPNGVPMEPTSEWRRRHWASLCYQPGVSGGAWSIHERREN